MPRRQQLDREPGYALVLFSQKNCIKGKARNLKCHLTAGHSHRLTSGGKAEGIVTRNFLDSVWRIFAACSHRDTESTKDAQRLIKWIAVNYGAGFFVAAANSNH
jgi:hypothetical protein